MASFSSFCIFALNRKKLPFSPDANTIPCWSTTSMRDIILSFWNLSPWGAFSETTPRSANFPFSIEYRNSCAPGDALIPQRLLRPPPILLSCELGKSRPSNSLPGSFFLPRFAAAKGPRSNWNKSPHITLSTVVVMLSNIEFGSDPSNFEKIEWYRCLGR